VFVDRRRSTAVRPRRKLPSAGCLRPRLRFPSGRCHPLRPLVRLAPQPHNNLTDFKIGSRANALGCGPCLFGVFRANTVFRVSRLAGRLLQSVFIGWLQLLFNCHVNYYLLAKRIGAQLRRRGWHFERCGGLAHAQIVADGTGIDSRVGAPQLEFAVSPCKGGF
jgi:hypothetical protein